MKNILLLHGWDYELYSKKTKSDDAWNEYKVFLNMLNKHYNVYTINFPGFCGEIEPSKKEWDIEDFSKYVLNYIKKININFDIILGYSFGGAVAIDLVQRFNLKCLLVLIAPAIIRNVGKSKDFIKTPKIFNILRKTLRNLYVSYIIKTPEMKYGTQFLKNTYQIIVRKNLKQELLKINPKRVILIYGTEDTAVDPENIIKSLSNTYKINLIEGANHDNILTEKDYIDKIENIIISET